MYDLNRFCNIIASLRKQKGWTQTLFSEKLGISPQSVSKWECGVPHNSGNDLISRKQKKAPNCKGFPALFNENRLCSDFKTVVVEPV